MDAGRWAAELCLREHAAVHCAHTMISGNAAIRNLRGCMRLESCLTQQQPLRSSINSMSCRRQPGHTCWAVRLWDSSCGIAGGSRHGGCPHLLAWV